MKLNKIVLLTLSSIFILASCTTTSEITNIETTETSTTKTAAANKTHTAKEKTVPKPVVVEETKEEIFLKSLEGISIKKIRLLLPSTSERTKSLTTSSTEQQTPLLNHSTRR